MSFREKSTWVTFVGLLLFGFFFARMGLQHLVDWGVLAHDSWLAQWRSVSHFGLFLALVVALVAVSVVTHIVMALRAPGDANAPLDERERLISVRAAQPAYFVLLAGTFLTIGTLHMGISTWGMAHCVLFVIWMAELLRYGLQLVLFRRGA